VTVPLSAHFPTKIVPQIFVWKCLNEDHGSVERPFFPQILLVVAPSCRCPRALCAPVVNNIDSNPQYRWIVVNNQKSL
jgi:hypothetical protein